MAVLKCKMCGGELTIREGISIVKCDYCGNTNTLPKENSANNHDLFARANELRARCEFDLAERAYEKIIEVAPQEAEAYWGLVLCKYGIEYVEDPKTKKRIPTCHRASFEAITADYNYQKAIEYADVVSRPVYEEEARVIDAIQKEILALSYKEEKYDVFICYKETDDNGKRTEDSAIANDIYYQLTQEGYKVFYAAITLEDKLGQDYEPIIFAALNSAKVMLVVGTKAEYFNAVWVKNEWSRFLKIMKQDRTKLMFPCYKGISAYELPDELSHMQAQDMGKIGFINDLIRGIKKVIVKEKPKKDIPSDSAQQQPVASKMNPTLRRAFIFIEDGNWNEANEYLEKVLDQEPENALAYLGKLLIDLKVKKQEKLAEQSQTFDHNQNYKKAYKYADKELKEKLNGYNESISKRNDEKKKDEEYSAALAFASKAKTEEDYKQAGKKFAALSGWKDSSRRAKECFDKAEAVRKDNIYTKALALAQSKDPAVIKQSIPLFESIPDWKDSSELLAKIPELCETARKNAIYDEADKKYNGTDIAKIKEAQKLFLSIEAWKDSKKKAELCIKRIQELEEKAEQERLAREKAERERRIAEAKKKKLIKKVSMISGSAVVAIAIALVLLFTLIIPTIQFNKATELFNAGKYDEAMAIYNELDGFGESNNKINIIDAINTVENGDYEDGIEKMLNNGATVTISYDCAGGELSTTNTKSVKATTNSTKNVIIASAEDSSTSFIYNNVNDFEGLKPSTRNGYTFKQWKLVTCTPTITKNSNSISISFVAEWTAKDYIVTYDLDGGNVNGENVIGYNPDDESFTLINPTRTGYTFDGWTGTDLSDKTMEVTVPSGSYGNRSYTANWHANTYTVTYDANGGTASKTEDTATYDEVFTLATVERKGYTFLGWFSDTTQYEDFDNWERIEGLDLKAEWQINTYTITYTLNGGNVTNVETYTVEDTVIINAPEKTGYTFDGWTGTGLSEETKSITLAKGTIGDKEYTANWTANTYKVTYDANGGTASKTKDTATYDSNFTLATAERKGYDFVAWKEDNATYQNGDWKTVKDVTLVAEWKIIEYTITYNLDGGSIDDTNPATYTVEDTITLKNPTKMGYSFAGWIGTDLTDKTMSVIIPEGSIGTREYTATWTANEYTLLFNVNGGDALVSNFKTVVYDSRYSLPTPTRRGYDFVAWKTSTGIVYSGGNWDTADNVTVIAEWKIINYAITYDLDGGSVSGNPDKYTVEDAVTLIAPERTGYTFAGWTGTDLTDKTISVTIPKGSIGAREYTATWTANTYTLTYNVNGGNALADDTQSVTYNAGYSVVEPTRTGYSFVKWATSAGTVYSGGTWKTTSNVTVIAEWKANTYTVTYNGNGGTPAKTSDTATYDINFSLTTARRTGYEFVCWEYNGKEFTSGQWVLTNNVTLIAKWNPLTYTITYIGNGGTISQNSQEVTYDTNPTLATAERTGYDFKGWYNGTQKYVSGDIWKTAKDIVLTAEWEARTDTAYTVRHHQQNIHDDNYTVFETENLNGKSDSSITPAVNTYTGFTSPKATTTTIAPNGSRVIDYYYTRNSYTITLITNGGTGSSITQKFGSNLDTNTWSTREGFTLGGWFIDETLITSFTADTMPASNKTLYAWWSEENKPTDFSYSGTSAITVSAYNGTSTTMWIPSYIGGKIVTTIPESAFENKTGLVKVIAPDTITSIGLGAFKGCNAIEDITLPFVGASADATHYNAVFGYIFGYEEVANEYKFVEYTDISTYYYSTAKYDYINVKHSDVVNAIWQYTSFDYYGKCKYVNQYPSGHYENGYVMSSKYYYIPATIRRVAITNQTAIPTAAFNSCNFIEIIQLPENTTSIGGYAFQNCSALMRLNGTTDGEFNISESVTVIGSHTFYGCTTMQKILFVAESKLETISDYAFKDCVNLSEVQLPSTVTSIGKYAFSGCVSLAKINSDTEGEMLLPENLITIGEYAFQNLELITKVVAPESVTSIGLGAFKGCNAIEDITLPFVGASADATHYNAVFGYIFGYEEVANEYKFVEYTDISTYYYSTAKYDYINVKHSDVANATWQYTNFDYYGVRNRPYGYNGYYDEYGYVMSSKYYYIPATIRRVTITSQTNMPVAAFNNCGFIETITLSADVENIGDYAFQNCSALAKLNSETQGVFNISNSVTVIGDYAFSGCSLLSKFNTENENELIIPNGVEIIGQYAFQDVLLVEKVVVADSVTSIGLGTFKGCVSIKDITLPFVGKSANATYYDAVFGYIFGYTSYQSSSTYSGSPSDDFVNANYDTAPSGTVWQYSYLARYSSSKYYRQSVYYYIPMSIKSVTITTQVDISVAAFNGCSFIEAIHLPENTTSIGGYAFQNCGALKRLNSATDDVFNLPQGLFEIGNYAFQDVLLVEKVVVPDTVTEIGLGVFKGCAALEDITLPFVGKSVDATYYQAVFGYIFGYKNILGNEKNYTLEFINKKCGTSTDSIWQYTDGSYLGSSGGFSCYFENSYHYYIPSTIRNVTITVQTEIPVAAFNNCDFIESITLPTTVTSIGEYAFQNCSALKRLSSNVDGEFILPTSINVIGTNTFTNCGELVKVAIPTNVTNIDANAFQSCAQLTDADFADESRLKGIGAYAFADCISLSEVQLPNSVTSIGDYAFSGCISIAKFNSQVEGELIIPENTVIIGEYAFQNLLLISKVVVPDTVTEIGLGVFKGCAALEDITLPFVGKSVDATYYQAVFGYIFGYKNILGNEKNYTLEFINKKCGTSTDSIWQYTDGSYLGSSGGFSCYFENSYHYYIPSTIRNVTITVQTEIPVAAFNNCEFIESITLPTTVTSIGEYAFQDCNAIISQTHIPTLSYWNGTNISTALLGEGTEINPYQINSAADLAYLSNSVNGGERYEGKYFVLNVNINLNSKEWTSIGTKANPFAGIFNGNCKKITNLSITADTAYAGLFGYVSGTIKNLAIESGTVAPKSTAANSYAGVLVGYLAGTVENCYSNANITISTTNIVYAGGLVGYVDTAANVKDCYASGDVSVTTTSGFAYAGGFVGSNKGTIDNCLAFGNVKAKGQSDAYSRNGGFVATNSGALTNCYRSEEQVLTKYTTTGATYCEDGTVAPIEEMIAYAQIIWDSTIWEFEAEYPSLK